jgi:hypothetical protein
MEIAKSVGFNSRKLAAIGLNLSFIDTSWLVGGKFNFKSSWKFIVLQSVIPAKAGIQKI